jgi:hypothetical protein
MSDIRAHTHTPTGVRAGTAGSRFRADTTSDVDTGIRVICEKPTEALNQGFGMPPKK